MKPTFFHKRRRIILLVASVVVLTALFLAWPRGPREPVYQGIRYTEWMAQLENPNFSSRVISSDPDEPKIRAAIAAIGTNALPFLLHELARSPSGWRQRFDRWAGQHTSIRIRLGDDPRRLNWALQGMAWLGTNAAPAIPALMQSLGDPAPSPAAGLALIFIGDPSIPHLTAALSSPNPFLVSNAFTTLQLSAQNPGPGRDALAQALRHPRAEVRQQAVRAWGYATSGSRDVVPDMLKLTEDPSPPVARMASNHLVRLSQTGAEPVRIAASNALLTLRTNAPPTRTP